MNPKKSGRKIASALTILVLSIFLVITLAFVFVIYAFLKSDHNGIGSNSYTKQSETSKVSVNTKLDDSIDSYLEDQNDMLCTHKLYGTEDNYAYVWVVCMQYSYGSYGHIGVKTGFSKPAKIQYSSDDNEITSVSFPEDGTAYASSLKSLFPEKYSEVAEPEYEEVKEMEYETKLKFIQKQDAKAVEKLRTLTDKYPEYKDWEIQESYAGKELGFKVQDNSYYFSFITNGSGVYIVGAKCFEIDGNNVIHQMDFDYPSYEQVIPRYVDPVGCKGIK